MEFGEYVSTRGPALLRFAVLLCDDNDLAQDVTQTALLQAFQKWRRVSKATYPDAYVRKILFNIYLQILRRKSSTELLHAELPDREDRTAQFPTRLADRDEVWRLIAQLDVTSRAVLVLRFYDDMNDSDVGDLLGLTAAGVRTRRSRALRELRRSLDVNEPGVGSGPTPPTK